MTTLCLGLDFSSAPAVRKPQRAAWGRRVGDAVILDELRALPTQTALADMLLRPGPWVGGFDLPFGLPRELVLTLGWPSDWAACMDHYCALSRAEIRATFAAFCAARPAGGKFAHRACERPALSSPSMKWVNPPVAYMLHAGVPLLRGAGLALPAHGLAGAGLLQRVALEAYPGLLARHIAGRQSYKADDRARQTRARREARAAIVAALQAGQTPLRLRLELTSEQSMTLIDDAMGDNLDAVLCLLQAAWAVGQPRWGLPADVDPLEGWIVSA